MHYKQTYLVFRQLLARLRDVMSEDADSRSRLSACVSVIAADLGAEACSIYVRRAGDVLELFATQGLRPEAVHVTRLRIGEGLVGEIAATGRPLALADAQHHPRFVYRPETGEEAFHSFLGVPVLGRGRVLGVLAVWNQRVREHSDEEIELLQTVAMVLAELVAAGDVVPRTELAPAEGIGGSTLRLEGMALTRGIGIGIAVLHHPHVAIGRVIADDRSVEHERLRDAVSHLHVSLDEVLGEPGAPAEGEYRDILETYRMITADVGWLGRMGEAIESGLTAEAAVLKVTHDIRTRLGEASEAYLRERAHDFEDLANRLLRALVGDDGASQTAPGDRDTILIARNLGPAELLNYNTARLRGIVLEEGSQTSHATIVARALDIPVLGHVRDATARIDAGDLVILDVDHAQAFVRPSDDIRHAFVRAVTARSVRRAEHVAARDLPALTRDGVSIQVCMNAGLLVDLEHLDEFGADGIGLYRTEVPFLVRSELPTVASQVDLYRRVLDRADGKPVVFRTLDVGGDKMLPYWERTVEENPAMGWRAIRVAMDRPAMLRQQLRAMIRAAAGRSLSVMFPLIACVSEFDFARDLLSRELAREAERPGPVPQRLEVGAMIEVPSILFELEALFPRVDFLSIGTNDLVQFLFASDRGNANVAERYGTMSSTFLKILADVARRCEAAGVPVGVCGEMAGHPLEAMALIGVGFRRLSVSPSAVGSVKSMARTLHIASLKNYFERICREGDENIRTDLATYGRDHGVLL